MGSSTTKPLKLNDVEKDILRTSWDKAMKNRANFSVEIFLRVFQRIDRSQDMFEQLRGLSLAQVKADSKMKAHCLRVTAILTTVLKELDDPVCMVEMFRNIARTHYKLGNKLGKTEYDIFGEIFLSCLSDELGSAFDSKTRAAWTKAFQGVEDTLVTTREELMQQA